MVKEKHLVIGFLTTIIVFSMIFLIVKVAKSEGAEGGEELALTDGDTHHSDESNSKSDEFTSNSSSDEEDKKKREKDKEKLLPRCRPDSSEETEETSEERPTTAKPAQSNEDADGDGVPDNEEDDSKNTGEKAD